MLGARKVLGVKQGWSSRLNGLRTSSTSMTVHSVVDQPSAWSFRGMLSSSRLRFDRKGWSAVPGWEVLLLLEAFGVAVELLLVWLVDAESVESNVGCCSYPLPFLFCLCYVDAAIFSL